jgi:tol-pal system protein YbgF
LPKRSAAVVLSCLLLPAAVLYGQDKSKRTYELIYEDVQALKTQVQALSAKVDRGAEDILRLQEQLKNVADLLRQVSARQSSVDDSLRAVPSQYSDLARKVDVISSQLLKIAADLSARAEPAAADQAQPGAGKEAAAPAAKAASGASPQEAFNVAYNDYLKGNFQLAVSSFSLYRQQFPDSPLADDALYWIGEAFYSQKKYVEAVDAFDNLLLTYPRSDKAAAGLLKKGLALTELGKKDQALAVFKLLAAKYPLEAEARIAADKIKELTEK